MPRRVVEVGISKRGLSLEELEEALAGFEERIRESLLRVLGRRLEELDLVVEGELGEDGTLRVRVDLRATGRLIAPYSYEEVLARAIDEAAGWLEAWLRHKGSKGEGREDV